MSINIKPILDQAGVALQRQASNMFGAAVEDFTRQSLGNILGNNNTAVRSQPGQPGEQRRPQGAGFVASSYAAALSGGSSYRPKMKFLFKVEFVFTPEAANAFPEVLGGASSNDFTFLVKAVDRPKIDFEYEDDVNMYNFRTKVLKKVRHRELTITFLDDTGNRVINFFRAIMMIQSPITRRQMLREGSTVAPSPYTSFGASGMSFVKNPANFNTMDNAMRGVLESDIGNIIQTIRVKQMYMDSGADLSHASREIIYDFVNARIVSFDLDDLSHDLSEASIVTMQFDYDWMEIVDVGPLAVMDGPHPNIFVKGSTAPLDMAPQQGAVADSAGGLNPFARIIGGTAGRTVQTLSSDVVNRAVQGIAGNGIFGQVIGSYASNAVSGIIGGATRDIATGASQVLSNATSSLSASLLGDSGLGRVTQALGVTRSTPDRLGNFISNLKL